MLFGKEARKNVSGGRCWFKRKRMSSEQDQFEIRFRLADGSDIGPTGHLSSITVLNLKESIIARWPKEKENGPRTVKDVRLISCGRVLEDNRPVIECMFPNYAHLHTATFCGNRKRDMYLCYRKRDGQ